MPFLLTHLHVAKNIINSRKFNINSLPQFYLGVSAPDAVHNRLNYISEYKKASHLCVGDEKWGMISNNDEWISNVLTFLLEHKDTDDKDFLMGYCTHILTDIYNNINVWTPFKKRYQGELWDKYGGLYHQESGRVEIELALNPKNKEDFWCHLQNSQALDFYGLIFRDEIIKQKENILNEWYVNKELQDNSENKVVSIKSSMSFIRDATVYVIHNLPEMNII